MAQTEQADHVADKIISSFKRDDERRTGVISVWKLKEICRRLGHDDETITSVLNSYRDTCGSSGSGIDYEEFVTWMFDVLPPEVKEQVAPVKSLHGAMSKNLWDRVTTRTDVVREVTGTGSMSMASIAHEAKAVSQEGVSLHSPVKKRLSSMEIARSFLRFSPALLHHLLYTGNTPEGNLDACIVKPFRMALLLIDVSGFTRMSVKLGAELTRKHTSRFFEDIIHCITGYGGDVLKFLGDALLVAWPAEPDATLEEQRHIANAAAACAAEVMGSLNGFVISEDLSLTLHGGLAIGDVYAFDVGNAQRREFLIGGSVLVEIGDLEGEAGSGQLIMSTEIADLLPDSAREAVTESGGVRLSLCQVDGMKRQITGGVTTKISPHLSIQFSGHDAKMTEEICNKDMVAFTQRYVNFMEAHVPPSCREYVREGGLSSLGEMRHVTTMFISLDVLVPHLNKGNGALVQKAFQVIVEAAKYSGGAIRQFVLDDKGCVVILAWGVPRAAWGHGQDATRAVQTSFHVLHGLHDLLVAENALDRFESGPHIGIAAGSVYVGLIGAAQRCEYAMIGPSVNLAARLMGKAKPWQVLVEECVHDKALSVDSTWRFEKHAAVKAKGYDKDVPVFVPEEDATQHISAKKNLIDEFTEIWMGMPLQVQRVGKVASVLAEGEDDFPMLALVSIVNAQNIATYAEAKKAVTQLQDSRFFRLFRGTQRGNPSCAFAVDEVHQWVLALCTAEWAAEIRGLFTQWKERTSTKAGD